MRRSSAGSMTADPFRCRPGRREVRTGSIRFLNSRTLRRRNRPLPPGPCSNRSRQPWRRRQAGRRIVGGVVECRDESRGAAIRHFVRRHHAFAPLDSSVAAPCKAGILIGSGRNRRRVGRPIGVGRTGLGVPLAGLEEEEPRLSMPDELAWRCSNTTMIRCRIRRPPSPRRFPPSDCSPRCSEKSTVTGAPAPTAPVADRHRFEFAGKFDLTDGLVRRTRAARKVERQLSNRQLNGNMRCRQCPSVAKVNRGSMAHDQSDIVKNVVEAGGSRVDRRSARDDQGFEPWPTSSRIASGKLRASRISQRE